MERVFSDAFPEKRFRLHPNDDPGAAMPLQEVKGAEFISIVVADSTRIHTQLLADAMRSDAGLQVVASASTSEELLAAVTRVPVDVAVISYSLDDRPGRGTEVLRELRLLRPQVKGILLLDTSRPQDVLECFRAGAKGIFAKHERLESLCKAIRCVHEGQIWARSVELEHALEALANSPVVRATNHKGLELLSTREREVVQNLAAGMTNREIAESLGLSRHTVKNYLFRIFDKLGVSSRTELLYLTMSGTPANTPDSADDPTDLPALLKAAEAGHSSAQLRLAEHYSQANGSPADRVSAYMWCLLSENTNASLRDRIETSKTDLTRTLSPQELSEAERRAADWQESSRIKNSHSLTAKRSKKPRTGVEVS
jgi:DNA-binding NarL/FixJ family response regulator